MIDNMHHVSFLSSISTCYFDFFIKFKSFNKVYKNFNSNFVNQVLRT